MRNALRTSTGFPTLEDFWQDLIVIGDDSADTIVVDLLQPIFVVDLPESYIYFEYFLAPPDIFVSSGGGDDVITVSDAGDSYIETGNGADTITVEHALIGNSGSEWFIPEEMFAPKGVSAINSGSGADTITVTNAQHVSIVSGSGADSVIVYFSEIYSYQSGTEQLSEGEFLGGGWFELGDGNDDIQIFDAGQIFLSGGNGNDWVEIIHGVDYDGGIYGGIVSIWDYVARGESWISGGAGNDFLSVEQVMSATVFGGAGNDQISVVHGNETEFSQDFGDAIEHHTSIGVSVINGGAGHDIIKVANALDSEITGGRGADRISIAIENLGDQSNYVITDFSKQDTFVFRSGVFDDIAALDAVATVTEIGSDVRIDIPGSGDFADTTIILEGIAGTGEFDSLADLADSYLLSF